MSFRCQEWREDVDHLQNVNKIILNTFLLSFLFILMKCLVEVIHQSRYVLLRRGSMIISSEISPKPTEFYIREAISFGGMERLSARNAFDPLVFQMPVDTHSWFPPRGFLQSLAHQSIVMGAFGVSKTDQTQQNEAQTDGLTDEKRRN